jgi:hypothetical protein
MRSFDSVVKAFSTKVIDYKINDEQCKRKVEIWTINPRNIHMLIFYEKDGNFFVEEEDSQLQSLIKKKIIDR